MKDLRQQLAHLARLLRLTAAARALLWWLAGSGLVALLLATGARLAGPPWLVPAALALVCLGLLGALVFALAQRLRARQVARLIERHNPALKETVLSATELLDTVARTRHFSPTLTAEVIRQAEAAVAAMPRETLLQTRRLRPLALLAGSCLILGAVTCAANRQALAGMLRVTAELPAVTRLVPPVAEEAPLPVLAGVKMEIVPPPHTGLPTRTLTTPRRVLRVPVGSKVTLSALRPAVGELSLRVGKQAAKLSVEGHRAAAVFTLRQDTPWRFAAYDSRHVSARGGLLRALADLPPSVRLTHPASDLTLATLKPLKLSGVAADDYGLSEVALEYLVAPPPGSKDVRGGWQRLQLGADGSVQKIEFEWDLTPLNLRPGQSVSYRLRARDNGVLGGGRVGYSRTRRVTLADRRPEEAQERLEQSREQQEQGLERLREQAQEIQKQLTALNERVQQGEMAALDPAQRAELQQAADQLREQAESLRQALAQAQQEVRQSGESAPELARKLEEVNRLLSETLDKQLQEALQKLQQAAQGQKPEQLPETLQQAQEAQKQLLERLDQLLALLQQAKLEGALAALRQEVEKLVARQQELLDRGQRAEDRPAQSRDQRDLARDTERVPEKLEQLADRVADPSQPQAAAKEAQELADKLRQIAERLRQEDPAGQMQQAVQSLRSSQPQQASGPQKQALHSLQQAASDLAGAQADIYSEMREELQRVTAELVRSALYLSGQQEELRAQTEPYEDSYPEQLLQAKPTLQQLARRQQALTAGSGRVARRLAELAKKTPLVDPGLAQQAGGVAEQSLQAERELGAGAMATALNSQESVMVGLNQLAQRLLESEQQFQQASAQMAMQEYLKRLEQLARQQGALNEQTQKQGGGAPQQVPGGTAPGQLAAQQAAIREALEKMLGQAGNQRGLGDKLGGVPGQMDEVEQDLRGSNVTRETHRRQADILHKMLDAQRSLYQKDREERQRKAEAPRPYKPISSPPALRPNLARKLTPPAHTPTRQELPLGYEDLTRQYFEALGRER